MLEKIRVCSDFIKSKIQFDTDTAIILGTGLGKLAEEIVVEHYLDYKDIPHFPVSTVEGHSGRLIFGKLGNKNVIAMQGRFHFYEGYSMQEVTFPIRVFKFLGIKRLFISNASGGMNPSFDVGDIMVITDHINMFPEHPLRGKNYEEFGPRFPDMSQAYSKDLIEKAEQVAKEKDIKIQKGVYVGVSGPTYETPAEYKFFRVIGGDAVGMSTVPEVIVARHMDMECFGISIITDSGAPGKLKEITHEEVQEVGEKAQPRIAHIIRELI